MAFDLIPLLSYLMRGRRCKYCSKPISSRYFWGRATNGRSISWYCIFRFRHNTASVVAMPLFGAILVPIFSIDLRATSRILNQLNLLVFALAEEHDVYGIVAAGARLTSLARHWLPVTILGVVVGVSIFGLDTGNRMALEATGSNGPGRCSARAPWGPCLFRWCSVARL